MTPFDYPNASLVRRHGPSGYASYERYRPWLRDEFVFRCIYCLQREQWVIVRGNFHIDHFLPQARHAEGTLDYDNLLYSCVACNTAKGDQTIPDPCDCMLDGQVVVHEDGKIEAKSRNAARIILVLGLDDPEYREFRKLWIGIVQMAQNEDYDLFRRIMKYPDDLPDVASRQPPHNSRPDGIQNSFKARRARGELPETY